ncbi:HypC/HybG/HupF family hydrogenase formation chaperone [Sporomusa acidovorans]|uniref:Hydrogenase maturation factor HypC n=1 Tax=Sporomusa acidovorans (strain ATCC 49682 / DSM 3132 / Mol) TaxID=1123286 RepID=A0ABZ3J7F6_SPOA4|nr:HypC/HybG/HupF family hydrogenase formation chaperone [Sporomusa acidovorans]OZC24066.1 hydrogenase isoenzymes formation protein HypC [Sporomusa acidovorans DSM 3132]SDF59533.1 Hydrogenase maturation protein HypC [Sporomusa acidovorans]
MCLAVPAKIIERSEFMGTVDISGVTRQVSLMLLPDAAVGDYVLVHAGFAIQTIDEAEALKTLELFKELECYETDS